MTAHPLLWATCPLVDLLTYASQYTVQYQQDGRYLLNPLSAPVRPAVLYLVLFKLDLAILCKLLSTVVCLHKGSREGPFFSQLAKTGQKNLDAGLGCGVGIGYGFGVGLFLKPGVGEGIVESGRGYLEYGKEQLQARYGEPCHCIISLNLADRQYGSAPFLRRRASSTRP